MRVRKLSPTGDYTWGQSLLNFWIDSPDGVGQVVQTALLLWQGEWYLDITAGMPWMSGVMGYKSQTQADTTIQQGILGVTGVDQGNTVNLVPDISKFQSDLDRETRKYSAQVNIDTIYGPTKVTIQNSIDF